MEPDPKDFANFEEELLRKAAPDCLTYQNRIVHKNKVKAHTDWESLDSLSRLSSGACAP